MRQTAFLDVLEDEIASSQPRAVLGLLLVQVGGVEELNFSAGYRVVDDLLAATAVKLETAFKERARVVRIGTGRFAILLRELKSEAHAILAANRVERIAQEPMEAHPFELSLNVAQGIALHPLHATAADRLLQCAELALNVARNGGASPCVYRPEETDERGEVKRVESELARALVQGGIEAYFQPQIDIESGRAVGGEALLRCRDRSGVMLSPEAIVTAAERTNRLADLTSAMLNTALRYAAEWPMRDGRLSVNVSTVSLKDADFPSVVKTALEIWNRPPQNLTIEITESAFIDEPDKSFAAMRDLKAAGVRVSIDDFGTGYSSLSYFTNIPANELKVDKSFVFKMSESEADRRIVRAVVNLAHGFDLKVVAEGVEDDATLELLRKMRCDIAQGFGIGKPMPPAQFVEWLASWRPSGTSHCYT
jgi:predicted signal transduction protein with EAL and GGDEF domain